jgi:hypothetical protein
MALTKESWHAPSPTRRPRRAELRLVPAPPVSRAHLLTLWLRALDAADEAIESAYREKAFDASALVHKRRILRAERDWLQTHRHRDAISVIRENA